MQCKLVGIQGSDYVSKKDGERKVGITLHITHDFPRSAENVKGMCTEEIYISNKSSLFDKCRAFPCPALIDVDYDIVNGYSRLFDINLVK